MHGHLLFVVHPIFHVGHKRLGGIAVCGLPLHGERRTGLYIDETVLHEAALRSHQIKDHGGRFAKGERGFVAALLLFRGDHRLFFGRLLLFQIHIGRAARFVRLAVGRGGRGVDRQAVVGFGVGLHFDLEVETPLVIGGGHPLAVELFVIIRLFVRPIPHFVQLPVPFDFRIAHGLSVHREHAAAHLDVVG